MAGTITYYNNVASEKNSRIALLESQLSSLNSKISNVENQITNLTSSNLVATLTTQEILKFSQEYPGGPNYTIPYDFVQITGTVTNTGGGTAYNTGLRVVGYDMYGALIANVTVPLGSGFFGSDKATDAYGNVSSSITTLGSGKIATVNENVIHEGAAYNWTVTPVWTMSPTAG
jgi:hypothetical protein